MTSVDASVQYSVPSFQVATQPAAAAAPAASTDDGFSFDDLLDVVNPLQHLPVVGTLYRHLTGDTIKTPEKIAGDTLYGGLWGFVSSIADTAFQALTGRNFGDTVLAFLTGDDQQPTAVASVAKPDAPAQSSTPGTAALSASLSRQGVDTDTAQRAMYAYRRAFTLAPQFAPN